MPNLIWELGAENSSYKKTMDDTATSTEGGFRRIGGAATKGAKDTEDGFKGMQKGVRELKEIVTAGGAIELVKRFFELAAEAAAKSKNAYSENGAAVLRFTEAAKGAKESFADFAMNVVGMANRIGEAVGVGIREAWDLANGATVEQLNLVEATEKAAAKSAARLADSKKYAQEFNQVNSEAKQIEEQRQKGEREALPLEEQRAMLIQKQSELLRKNQDIASDMDRSAKERLDARKALNEAAKLGVDIATLDNKISDEATKQMQKRHEQEEAVLKVKRDALEPAERHRALTEEIAALQTTINSGSLTGNSLSEAKNILASRQVELQQTINKEHAAEVELRKKSALDLATQIQDEEILAKSAGVRTGAESELLRLHQLQSQEKRTMAQIQDLLEKKTTEGLTPAEQKNLSELIKQDDKLKEQIANKQNLIAAAGDQKKAEEAVTDEYHKQVQEAQTLNKEFNNFRVSMGRTGQSYDQQSTEALTGVRDRLNKQLNEVSPNTGMLLKNANINTDYGAWLSASTIKSELEKVNQELQLRQSVQQYAARYGDTAARYQYGDTVTQRALSNLADQGTRSAIATEQINQRLNAAGFGLNGPG